MNEIDTYMSLVDEVEVDSILRLLKCNVKSDNLTFKKTKIKTMLRSNHKMLAKKLNSPFTVILMKHKKSAWENLNEKDFFIELNKHLDTMPEYVKLANLLLKYPNDKDKYIEKINENKKNDKYTFDFDIDFDSKEEVVEYVSQLSNNQESLANTIKKHLDKAFSLNLLKPIAENIEAIKTWDIVDLNKSFKIDNEAENVLMRIEYIKTHKNIDKDVLNKLNTNNMLYLLFLFESSCAKNDNIKLIKLKNDIDELKSAFDKSEKNNLILEKQHLKSEKLYKKYEKDKIDKEFKYNKTIEDLKIKLSANEINVTNLNKMNAQIEVHIKENSQALKQIKDIEDKNGLLDIQLKEAQCKKEHYQSLVEDNEVYYKYTFPLLGKDKKIFGIIHSSHIKVAKIIFNEIEFIDINNWLNQIDNVKKIYIQREGTSTKALTKIKNYCSKNNILIIDIISIHNEKKLIENISIIINKNGVR
ncbi:hypothetical protein [Clostridium estertheticum]|uniref:Uncharacterized protein n=1 Tax=Clostridium estertheticum TaxID=238834 RepID=A0AA47ENI1_9CLOT|nr:hypothetical protein [Clostridium estertheticum]MBU3156923.1 hypothetical protein [Clostridium estertheticum]WAG62599.1 hypothetical protein LL038_10315 [Clostridium estertheticum]